MRISLAFSICINTYSSTLSTVLGTVAGRTILFPGACPLVKPESPQRPLLASHLHSRADSMIHHSLSFSFHQSIFVLCKMSWPLARMQRYEYIPRPNPLGSCSLAESHPGEEGKLGFFCLAFPGEIKLLHCVSQPSNSLLFSSPHVALELFVSGLKGGIAYTWHMACMQHSLI